MADNSSTYEIRINVTDKGELKVYRKEVDNLGSSVRKVDDAHKKADKSSKNFYNTMEKGAIGTSNSTKSFSKMAETIGSGSGGLVAAYAGLAANVFAVTAAFEALSKAAQFEQVARGLEAAGNRTGKTLGVMAENLRKVTNNAISTEAAMRTVAQVSSAGFGAKQVEALGKAAANTSFALGRSLPDAMDRLTKGTVKLEPELLDELGIMTKLNTSNAAYAAQLGKSESSLTQYEKRVGFLNAVLEEANLKFGGLSDSAGNSRAFDQLAATFVDLKNNILNLLNTAVKPLVSVFAGSQASLLGAALLFASTIRSAVLPGLVNLSNKSAKVSEALRDEAAATKNLAEAQIERAEATRMQKLRDAASIKVVEKGPKVFNELAESIDNGTASTKDREAAVRSLNSSISLHEAHLKNMSLSEDKYAAKKAIVETLKERRDTILHLDDIENKYSAEQTKNFITYENAQRKALAESQKAAAYSKYSAGIRMAANKDIVGSIMAISTAHKRMLVSARTAGESVVTAFDTIKIAATTTGATVRAAGAAFLAFLPYIGLIALAIGGIKDLLDSLKSDRQKEINETYKSFSEILDSTDDKYKAFVRAENSTASIASRAKEAIDIQSNAISELYENMQKVIDASSDYERAVDGTLKKRKEDDKAPSFLKNFFTLSSDTAKSYNLGIGKTSKLFDSLKGKVSNGIFSGLDKPSKSILQTFDKLTKLAPKKTVDDVLKLYGGYKKLSEVDLTTALNTIADMNSEINKRTSKAAEQVDSLVQALKDADLSTGDFLRGQVNTTPFDDMVKKLNQVNTSIDDIEASAARGENDITTWSKTLEGLGPNLEKFLTASTEKRLNDLRKQDAIVQSLQEKQKTLVDQGKNLNQTDTNSLAIAKRRLAANSNVLEDVNEELRQTRQSFLVAQSRSRLIDSQLTLEKARLSAMSQLYSVTASGEKARIEKENHLKDLDAAKLKIQKTLLQTSLDQNKVAINRLETELNINDAITDQIRKRINARVEEAKAAKDAAEAAYNKQNINPDIDPSFYIDKARYYSKELVSAAKSFVDAKTTLSSAIEDQDKLTKLQGLKDQTKNIRDSIKALNNEINAILESEVTASEKAAAVASKLVETSTKDLKILEDQKGTAKDTISVYEKINSLINNRQDTLGESLRLEKEGLKTSLEKLDAEHYSNLASLEAQKNSARATRAATAEERSIRADVVDHFSQQIKLENLSYQTQKENLQVTSEYQVLQKVIFDQVKDGVKWQQDSLSYIQKQVDAAKELSDAQQDRIEAETKLSYKRQGLSMSDEGEQALKIKAAERAYKLAVQESEIKKATIDLQYALLDAQREQLMEELRVRKQELAQRNSSGQYDGMIAQTSSIIDRLSKVNTQAIVEASKRAVDETVRTAKANLENELTPNSLGFNSVSASLRGIRELHEARKNARDNESKVSAISVGPLYKPVEKVADKMSDNIKSQIQVTNDLIDKMQDLIDAIKGKISSSLGNSSLGAIPKSIQDAAEYGIENGFRISELKGYGKGVTPGVHVGRGHAEGRAFDLNIGTGNVEANNKSQRDRMNKLASHYQKAGYIVLWDGNRYDPSGSMSKIRGEDKHFDHMHVEISRKAEAMLEASGKAIVDSTQKVSDATIQKVNAIAQKTDSSIAPAQSPEITVTAKRDQESTPSSNFGDLSKTNPNVPDLSAANDNSWAPDEVLSAYNTISASIVENLNNLGPQGSAVATAAKGLSSISAASISALSAFKDQSSTFSDKFTAAASVAGSAMSTIEGYLNQASQARVDNIQKEIDAEQARDGKSAESVEKITALSKKKDHIAKEQFKTNKKLQMAQAIIGTAAGVAQALSLGPIIGPIMAGVIGAMGAAQLAIISGTHYESASPPSKVVQTPSQLSIGKTGDSVDLAKQNRNLGGELGYLRGTQGYGSNSSNYSVVPSAYGSKDLFRGYGNAAYSVGEKGPEILTPETPIKVTPANENSNNSRPMSAEINIHAIDSAGVAHVLKSQRGNIISMLREAANANGETFLESIDTNSYTRPNVARL